MPIEQRERKREIKLSSISLIATSTLKKERVKRVVDGAKLFTVSNGVRFFESAFLPKRWLRVVLFRVHYDALEGRKEDKNKGGQTKKWKNRIGKRGERERLKMKGEPFPTWFMFYTKRGREEAGGLWP